MFVFKSKVAVEDGVDQEVPCTDGVLVVLRAKASLSHRDRVSYHELHKVHHVGCLDDYHHIHQRDGVPSFDHLLEIPCGNSLPSPCNYPSHPIVQKTTTKQIGCPGASVALVRDYTGVL